MNKQEFKETFITNLRSYLPSHHKDVKIMMRLAKKDERCYFDEEGKSVRKVVYGGNTWRIETKSEINNISEAIQFALYKTCDVNWSYKGK